MGRLSECSSEVLGEGSMLPRLERIRGSFMDVHFLHKPPNSIKDSPTPKALKTRLKRFLVSRAFYNAGEFLTFDWETAQLEDCSKWVALAINDRSGTTFSLYTRNIATEWPSDRRKPGISRKFDAPRKNGK
ncbi:hypothetical protein J6590_090249 [Homalodisca vitripennis]|nr:hypothetical protein J6590_090249 [Homalodisca vitripennis]